MTNACLSFESWSIKLRRNHASTFTNFTKSSIFSQPKECIFAGPASQLFDRQISEARIRTWILGISRCQIRRQGHVLGVSRRKIRRHGYDQTKGFWWCIRSSQAKLSCTNRSCYIVRSRDSRTVSYHSNSLTEHILPCPSVSWTVASLRTLCQPRFCLVHQLIYKLGQFGMIMVDSWCTLLLAHLDGAESISLPNRLHNLGNTTNDIGGWTGMSYKKAIDGSTRSWAGKHQQTTFKGHTYFSKQKKTPFTLLRSKGMSILFRNPMRGASYRWLMPTTSCTVPRSLRVYSQDEWPCT